jgi:hypothetical protein
MARVGATVAAGLGLALALGGCGSSGTSSLFSASPLDMFRSSPKATVVSDSANPASAIDTDYDCPDVKIRAGAATFMIGSKPGEGEPSALDLRYQGSITRTARECHLNGNIMTMKVGIEGRIITGPAGGPGTVDVPLRIAVVQEGVNPKPIVSKFARIPVTVASDNDRVTFTHVEPDITFPMPVPAGAIDDYVVYVGFDTMAAPEKKPAVKRKPAAKKPAAKPKQG